MPFQPRTADEIRAEMMAQLIAQTELTDVEEGGVAHTIMGVVALQGALIEQKIAALYRAFNLGGRGPDLDERVAEIPGFEPRRGPSAAGGAVMSFERLTADASLLVPAGIRIQSRLNADVEYLTTEAFTFGVGQLVYPSVGQEPVRAVCLTLGAQGNAQEGVLTSIAYTPVPAVVACTNVRRITGGLAREPDEALRWRALNYFASLCQTSKVALEYLARQFQAKDGTRARHAFVVEDANYPAYAELVVDDGTGFQGSTRPGATVTFTTPTAGQLSFHFEGPAATTPKVSIDGDLYPPGVSEWVTLHERGVAQMHPTSTLLATGGKTVVVSDYRVFSGFIAELQAAIEGLVTLTGRAPGWRVPGGRVRVMPPELQYITIHGTMVVSEGFDFNEVESRVRDEIVGFLQALAPGKPLILFQLAAALQRLPGVADIRFTTPSVNLYPANPRTKLYPLNGGIHMTA
jgi:uncharacterized phage protein gp47/JayE